MYTLHWGPLLDLFSRTDTIINPIEQSDLHALHLHFVHHMYDFRKNIKSNELYYSSMLRIRSLDYFIIYLLIFFMTLSNYKQIASFTILKLSAIIIRQIVKDQDFFFSYISFVPFDDLMICFFAFKHYSRFGNWFYQVSFIRELLIYFNIATIVVQSYFGFFLVDSSLNQFQCWRESTTHLRISILQLFIHPIIQRKSQQFIFKI